MGDILSGQLSEDRTEEVINALEIGDMDVRDIMVDREAIIALSVENTFDENLNSCKSGLTRDFHCSTATPKRSLERSICRRCYARSMLYATVISTSNRPQQHR
jgi:hypothetical protein